MSTVTYEKKKELYVLFETYIHISNFRKGNI